MPNHRPYIFGLTGNMGCGKSTVSRLLKQNPDIIVFDSDRIAKELLLRPENQRKLQEILGAEILSDEEVDFQKIAEIIFKDPEKKQELEAFIHPLTRQTIHERIQRISDRFIVIVESALIYEASWERYFDAVIVATCDIYEQYRRIFNRSNLSPAEIRDRLKAQLSQDEKIGRSRFVIDTVCTMEELQKRVDELYSALKNFGN